MAEAMPLYKACARLEIILQAQCNFASGLSLFFFYIYQDWAPILSAFFCGKGGKLRSSCFLRRSASAVPQVPLSSETTFRRYLGVVSCAAVQLKRGEPDWKLFGWIQLRG